MDSGVHPEHLDTIKSIIRRHLKGGRCEIYLFGSRVTGEFVAGSDLDVLIRADREIDLATMAFIDEALENSDLPFRVDILDYYHTSPEFLSRIVPAARRVA